MKSPSSSKKLLFACDRWLDKKEDDGLIERELTPVELGAFVWFLFYLGDLINQECILKTLDVDILTTHYLYLHNITCHLTSAQILYTLTFSWWFYFCGFRKLLCVHENKTQRIKATVNFNPCDIGCDTSNRENICTQKYWHIQQFIFNISSFHMILQFVPRSVCIYGSKTVWNLSKYQNILK